MLSLKILWPMMLTIVINQESNAINIDRVINKRTTELSRNVQRYSFNQNHPPFAEEYASIPVSVVYEEPPRNNGKSLSTTERAPTTFHPKFRNLVVVSATVGKETSTLNSNDEETRPTTTSASTDKTATPTIDSNSNIQVKGKYNVQNELQIPVAVIYDDEYTRLRGDPSKLKAGPKKIQDDQRDLTEITNSDRSSESKNKTLMRSYDKVISRRKPQSLDKLEESTEQSLNLEQSNAQTTETDDTKKVPVKTRTQQRREHEPRAETENTTRGVTTKIDSNVNSNTKSALASRNGNENDDDIRVSPRQKLQPKTTVVNETVTEILNDKTLRNENNLDDSKVKLQQNRFNTTGYTNVKTVNNVVIKGASNSKSYPQQIRRPVISNLDAKSAVTLQIRKEEKSEIDNQNALKVQQGLRNPTNIPERRQQPASNGKSFKHKITNQDTIEQTTYKDQLPEAITQDKQVSTAALSTEIKQDNYQNPPQRKQPNIESNTEKTSQTNTGSQTIKKGTGFPAIVSTTNSRTQPQRRRQPVITPKEDAISDDLMDASQVNDVEPVSHHPPSLIKAGIMETGIIRSSGNRTFEAAKNSRKRDPVVPIIESENHVYGNTGEFHYSYESGDGTKHYGDGVLKPFDEDANGEAVVGGFSYTDKEGNDFSLTYTADENGYRPVGAHLPTPPPIPPAIARALAYLATKTTPAEYDEVTESL